jgi:hypothetical protein
MKNGLGWYERFSRLWDRLNDSSADRYAASVRLRNFGRGPSEESGRHAADRLSIPSLQSRRTDRGTAVGQVAIEN